MTHLTHAYGDLPVLDGVTFTAGAGSLTALIGPSGCGKSTILKILAGLVEPTSGDALVGGVSVAGRPGRSAYMPQGDTLLPWRTAIANALLGARLQGADPVSSVTRARELFARFGVAGFEDAWPATLSGGMRQRVALLRTVITQLPVLLLDEPFGALDAVTRVDLQGWLGELLIVEPRTTVLVTHDVDEALRLADQIVVLSSRPARIVATHYIQHPRPRNLDVSARQDFAMLKRRILSSLRSAETVV